MKKEVYAQKAAVLTGLLVFMISGMMHAGDGMGIRELEERTVRSDFTGTASYDEDTNTVRIDTKESFFTLSPEEFVQFIDSREENLAYSEENAELTFYKDTQTPAEIDDGTLLPDNYLISSRVYLSGNSDKNIFMIREPHFDIRSQYILFYGLEKLFGLNSHITPENSVFLMEAHGPEDRFDETIKRAAGMFDPEELCCLINYNIIDAPFLFNILRAKKGRKCIPMYGIEDMDEYWSNRYDNLDELFTIAANRSYTMISHIENYIKKNQKKNNIFVFYGSGHEQEMLPELEDLKYSYIVIDPYISSGSYQPFDISNHSENSLRLFSLIVDDSSEYIDRNLFDTDGSNRMNNYLNAVKTTMKKSEHRELTKKSFFENFDFFIENTDEYYAYRIKNSVSSLLRTRHFRLGTIYCNKNHRFGSQQDVALLSEIVNRIEFNMLSPNSSTPVPDRISFSIDSKIFGKKLTVNIANNGGRELKIYIDDRTIIRTPAETTPGNFILRILEEGGKRTIRFFYNETPPLGSTKTSLRGGKGRDPLS